MGAMLPLLDPPPPPSFTPLPVTSLPPPLYHLDIVATSTTLAVRAPNGDATAENKQVGDSLDDGDDVLEPGWVWTRLKRNKRVTAEGWFQDVREIHLELEQALECVDSRRSRTCAYMCSRYQPGSIASLKPQTTEEEIETFLNLNGLEDAADKPFVIRSLDAGELANASIIALVRLLSGRTSSDQSVPLHLPRQKPTTLRRILRDHVDVRQPPRKSFFEWMARFTTSELEKERLEEFLVDPVSSGGSEEGVFWELTNATVMDRTRSIRMLQSQEERY
jgi:hypothetical protein